MTKIGMALLCLSGGIACAGTVQPDAKLAITPFPTARWNALLQKNVDAQGRVRYSAVDKGEVDRLYASVAASAPTTGNELPEQQGERRRTTSTPTTCSCGRTFSTACPS